MRPTVSAYLQKINAVMGHIQLTLCNAVRTLCIFMPLAILSRFDGGQLQVFARLVIALFKNSHFFTMRFFKAFRCLSPGLSFSINNRLPHFFFADAPGLSSNLSDLIGQTSFPPFLQGTMLRYQTLQFPPDRLHFAFQFLHPRLSTTRVRLARFRRVLFSLPSFQSLHLLTGRMMLLLEFLQLLLCSSEVCGNLVIARLAFVQSFAIALRSFSRFIEVLFQAPHFLHFLQSSH